MVVMRRTLLYWGGDYGDDDEFGYGDDVIRLMCNILG